MFVLHGKGGASAYGVLFGVLPFTATLGASLLAGRRTTAVPLALLSAAIGVTSWIVVAVMFAAKFAN